MSQRSVGSTLALILIAGAILLPTTALAGKSWRKGSNIYYTVDKVCRDGLDVTVADDSYSGGEQDPSTQNITVLLHNDLSQTLPLSDEFDINTFWAPIGRFGPRLAPPNGVQLSVQSQPIQADIYGDGSEIRTYQYYGKSTILWAQQLKPGDMVVTTGGSGGGADPVEDCYLNRTSVAEGATETIGSGDLRVWGNTVAATLNQDQSFGDPLLSNDAVEASDMRFRLDSLPAHGTLRLNNNPLAVGAAFSQADINSNRLSYVNNGDEAASDSFSFTVRATVALTDTYGSRRQSSIFNRTPDNETWSLNERDFLGPKQIFLDPQTFGNPSIIISQNSSGQLGNNNSTYAALSANGRYVVFETRASNLISSTNEISFTKPAIMLADVDSNGNGVYTETGDLKLSLITVAADGGNTDSSIPAANLNLNADISASGRYVAFDSYSTNLISGGTNGKRQVYVVDRDGDGDGTFDEAGDRMIRLVSAAPNGTQGNGDSILSSISDDGHVVEFYSHATNLVSGHGGVVSEPFAYYRGPISFLPLKITPANDPPLIAELPNRTTAPGVALGPLPLTISDPDTNPSELTVTATSSNQTFVPNANLVVGGSGSSRSLTITPASIGGATPTTVTITVNVSDGQASSSVSFDLLISSTPVNAPTISSIANQSVVAGQSTQPISISLADSDSAPDTLTLSATSSNPALVPSSAIVFGGSGAERTLTITPVSQGLSEPTDVIVTVTVSNGAASSNSSFILRVFPEGAARQLVYVPLTAS